MNNIKIMVIGNKYNNKPVIEDIISELNNLELSSEVISVKNPSDAIQTIDKENTNLIVLDVDSIVEDGKNIEEYILNINSCFPNIHLFGILPNMDTMDFFLDNDIEYILNVKTSVLSIVEKIEDYINQNEFEDFLSKDSSKIMQNLTAKQKVALKTEVVQNNEFEASVPVKPAQKNVKPIPNLGKSNSFMKESLTEEKIVKPTFNDDFSEDFNEPKVEKQEEVFNDFDEEIESNPYEELLEERKREKNKINEETISVKEKLQYNEFEVERNYDSNNESTYNLNQNKNAFSQPFMKKTIITLSSSKGGVGKTTTAKELASVVAAQAKTMKNPNVIDYNSSIKVALVDMNTSMDTLSAQMQPLMDAQIKPTINAWCDVIRQKSQVVRNQMNLPDDITFDFSRVANRIKFSPQEVEEFFAVDEKTGLYMIAAPQTISAWMDIEDYQLDIIFKYLRQVFDVVIIDTSNNLSNLTVSALEASDVRLLILTPDSASTASTTKFFDGLSETELTKQDFYLVFNRLQPKYYIEERDIADALEMKTISVSLPFENRLVQYADDCKILATDTKNKSKYGDAVKKLASSIVPIFSESDLETGKKKKKRGLFSRKKRG